jgi:hypothetical protein
VTLPNRVNTSNAVQGGALDTSVVPRELSCKAVSRLEENVAADAVNLDTTQLATLDDLAPAAGSHHTKIQMRMIDR